METRGWGAVGEVGVAMETRGCEGGLWGCATVEYIGEGREGGRGEEGRR